ncbi:MAG TPA: lipocalin family protein [Acetobacteraceae bacterium]|nr:lipocalin family protein [Acetobacteraceae bacterium]
MTTTPRLRSRATFAALVAVGSGALLALTLRVTSRAVANANVPTQAKPVDLGRYLGLWYELGRFKNWFERGCEGVTAEYATRPDGLINIVNTCRMHAPEGPRRTSKGRARIVSGSGNAKLKVSFFGPFFFGNYWVLDHADNYQWAIVGEPSGRFLWILCREPTPSQTTYDELVARARTLGYDMARFRRTRQHPA